MLRLGLGDEPGRGSQIPRGMVENVSHARATVDLKPQYKPQESFVK